MPSAPGAPVHRFSDGSLEALVPFPEGGGNDLFVHHSEIRTEGYASLDEGQKVEFQVGEGRKGPCATGVVPN